MPKRIRRNKRKKQRNIIIISVICLTFTLITAYSAFSTKLNITAKGNIVDKNRTIQSWTQTSNEDFHTDYYRENIVTATFLDTVEVPNNATKSWDVSVDKRRGVMAYVTESQTETGKYDLYIGAKDGVLANEDSSYLFYNFKGLTSINFNTNYNTSNTTNMTGMFAFCTNIATLDLSTFNTSNVTNMTNMFQFFDNSTGSTTENKLTKIIFGKKWVTSNVKSMAQMFVGCNNLTQLDVSTWDTSNVINMGSVFAHCTNLTSIDVSNWNTSNATEMSWLFMNCRSLQEIDVSNFDTRKVTGMRNMFYYCTNLKEINLCSFNTSKVTTVFEMFRATSNLTKIKVGPNWTTANADTSSMFKDSKISSVTTGEC